MGVMNTMDIMQKVGAMCKKLRKDNDLTLEAVAQLTGYTHGSIWNFEKGNRNNEVLLLWYLRKFNGYLALKELLKNEKIY